MQRRVCEIPDGCSGVGRKVLALANRIAVDVNGIDPVTSDLVRLRCAQVHHCRLCGSPRLVDTLILFSADAGTDLKVEPGVAELCSDVVKWSQQKALVATHGDAPPWEGIHVLDFDDRAHRVFAGALEPAWRLPRCAVTIGPGQAGVKERGIA